MQRRVYFLASDLNLDQAIAFLNSFRRYDPPIPLFLAPLRVYDQYVTGR
jgi:hypothetical protein